MLLQCNGEHGKGSTFPCSCSRSWRSPSRKKEQTNAIHGVGKVHCRSEATPH